MSEIESSVTSLEIMKPALVQLTDLLTITSTLVDQYENIFLNPTPIGNIEIKVYGTNGEIETIEIPNLAYLRQPCIIGNGSPEGAVEAALGTLYLDNYVEGTNSGFYIKTGNESALSNVGWLQISSDVEMQAALAEINATEESFRQSLETLPNYVFPQYDTINSSYEVGTEYTVEEAGYLELINPNSNISVTIQGSTLSVGNYSLQSMEVDQLFIVNTAGTAINWYSENPYNYVVGTEYIPGQTTGMPNNIWLEVQNVSSPISVTVGGYTRFVGNYQLLPIGRDISFKVNTADTLIKVYDASQII